MPKDSLPIQVNPIRFAESAAELRGMLLVSNMPRLLPSLFTPDAEVNLEIQFGVDRQGIKTLSGKVKVPLILQCQRCMEPFTYEIMSNFSYGIVGSEEEAKLLPGYYEPLHIQDENLIISDMVEEELIINLPIVSMHDPQDCKVTLPIVVTADSQPVSEIVKESPFKVIETLKVKPKQDLSN